MSRTQSNSDGESTITIDADPDVDVEQDQAADLTRSECCGALTSIREMDDAIGHFDVELRRRVEKHGYNGNELVEVCLGCQNAVHLLL